VLVIVIDKKNNLVFYTVYSITDLTNVIIPHFLKYPLLTHKQADFLLFKMAINIINRKEHLNTEGLRIILAIKASMNNGLTVALTEIFPNLIPVERAKVEHPSTIDPASFGN
jgi:hypothetical protein